MTKKTLPDLAWCAADSHFTPGDPALGVFLKWLAAFEASGTPNLVLLGDLFRVWLGTPGARRPDQARVLGALERLAGKERKVVYLAGNRDYFVEEAARGRGVSVAESWELEAGGKLVHFEHGDLINTSDEPYLRWRAFSRATAFRALFGALPPRWQDRLASGLEGRLAGTNRAYKAYEPAAELERWAGTLGERGVSLAVVGHFHRDAERRVGGVKIRFVPQFREEGVYLAIAPNGRSRKATFARG